MSLRSGVEEDNSSGISGQRKQDIRSRQGRRDRIRSAEQAVNSPGLASHFGSDPAGQHGEEAQDLQGQKNDRERRRHRKHDAALFDKTASSDQLGRHSSDDEGGGDMEGDNRIGSPVREGRIEDDLKPILGKASIDKLIATTRSRYFRKR